MRNVLVDCRIDPIEKCVLLEKGYNVLEVPKSKKLYNAICGHPDVLLCLVDSNTIIVNRDMPNDFVLKLKKLNMEVIKSQNSLEEKYPWDIMLNAVSLKSFFIHNLKYTDKFLYDRVINKILIDVKQGYTKCSTAVLNDEAIITNDEGIAEKAKANGIDVLFLPPGDIELIDFDYGFIGGCCGLVEENVMAFYGSLEFYKYGNEILNFIKKYDIAPLYLRNGKLIDRGSIFAF